MKNILKSNEICYCLGGGGGGGNSKLRGGGISPPKGPEKKTLIVICSTLSHGTLSACSSRLLVGFSEAFKRRSTSQFNFRSSWISSGSGSGS